MHATGHLVSGLHNRLGPRRLQQSQFGVYLGGGVFDQAQRMDEGRWEAHPTEGEIV